MISIDVENGSRRKVRRRREKGAKRYIKYCDASVM